jgi:hypothetical protein
MKSIEEALSLFEKSASMQAQTLETGNFRKGNRFFKQKMQSIVYLYEQNHLANLEPFLYH